MQSSRFIFFFKIWAIVFATTLYFAQASIAQSPEQRLIPLLVPNTAMYAPAIEDKDKVKEQLPIPKQDFVVYGRAAAEIDAGIAAPPQVDYRPILYARISELNENPEKGIVRMPDLESFFTFGGTLELLTPTNAPLEKLDIVISELMWGVDTGVKDETVKDPGDTAIDLPRFSTEEAQWIELYNTTDIDIKADLYLLFTPFVSYPNRDVADFTDKETNTNTKYKVLDAVSTLFFGKWELPGKSGRRPNTAFVSAYRNIDYEVVEDANRTRAAQLTGIPFGSYEESWQETPEEGRRNTELKIRDKTKIVVLPYIATPGTKHVGEVFIRSLRSSPVNANSVVINEVRNDTSRANIDWIELKNTSAADLWISKTGN